MMENLFKKPNKDRTITMKVIKRDGRQEDVSFDKVIMRIKYLCEGTSKSGEAIGRKLNVDPITVAQQVINRLKDGVTTRELDEYAAKISAMMILDHPDYGVLAGRIIVSNHLKNTLNSFADTIKLLYENRDVRGNPSPLVSREVYKLASHNRNKIQEQIDYQRDYNFDYFGFKTLERSYLIKHQTGNWRVQERPQHMLMRVALGLHGEDLDAAFETYHMMSQGYFTHATPTLFNSGTPRQQNSSCFLLGIEDDLDGIYKCISDCARISKHAGGIGVHISNIRSSSSIIRGTNGRSNGIVPMLRVFNDTARYIDQGGGKRMGSFAIYLEPWHPEILEFLDLKKNTGKEELRARDLFYAVWMPDLFMRKLKQAVSDKSKKVYWSTFCPDECPGLQDAWGEEFEKLYHKYENEGRARSRLDIMKVWDAILDAQKETGTPYLLYKDHANRKSNQQNIGTIKSSNLCAEIIQVSDSKETAVCNLASVNLSKHVVPDADGNLFFDHEELFKTVQVVTRNLNRVIDVNYYPTPETKLSNLRHRPMGIGVQGLADAFLKLGYPFDSEQAAKLNEEIFETMYYSACTTSCELAERDGYYESYPGSPASQGKLQFDLWGEQPKSGRWNWSELKGKIAQHGLRNSLLLAVMPTASTSQILGNNECIEPYTYNMYTRRVLAGEFTLVNKHLQNDLVERGLWTDEVKRHLIANRGSVQGCPQIPADMQRLYKTVFEIKQRVVIDMARDRGKYIDQSQSMNIHLSNPTTEKLTAMHLYSWEQGLKTGMYYLRREPVKHAQQVTVVPKKKVHKKKAVVVKKVEDEEDQDNNNENNGNNNADDDKDNDQSGGGQPNLCLLNDPDCLACQG